MKTITFKNITALREEILSDTNLPQYIILKLRNSRVEISENAKNRLVQVADNANTSIVYCDYREIDSEGRASRHKLQQCQYGSLNEDFDFGHIVLVNAADVIGASEDLDDESNTVDGGWYALRMRMTLRDLPTYLPESLYTAHTDADIDKSLSYQAGQKDFETMLVNHLYEINALCSNATDVDYLETEHIVFPTEMSIIIPVSASCDSLLRTFESALNQESHYAYNVIAVCGVRDSSIMELTSRIALEYNNFHAIFLPPEEDNSLGRLLNIGMESEFCGKFFIILPPGCTLPSAKVAEKMYYEFNCNDTMGMVVTVPLNLTPEGYRTNLLRLSENQLGMPIGFATLPARSRRFPEVDYGAVYAMALRITHIYDYKELTTENASPEFSFIPDSRWLTNEQIYYLDFLRTLELCERRSANFELLDYDEDTALAESIIKGNLDFDEFADYDEEDDEDDEDDEDVEDDEDDDDEDFNEDELPF